MSVDSNGPELVRVKAVVTREAKELMEDWDEMADDLEGVSDQSLSGFLSVMMMALDEEGCDTPTRIPESHRIGAGVKLPVVSFYVTPEEYVSMEKTRNVYGFTWGEYLVNGAQVLKENWGEYGEYVG